MAVAEHDVRAHEDKLEHMEHAEAFAAELKAAEASPGGAGRSATARRALDERGG